MANLFEFINSISDNKTNLMRDTENDDLAEKSYEPFMVNRGLSLYVDGILYAQEMNMYPDLPKKMQYEYLLHSIRKRKRFSKWPKKEKDELIGFIQNHYKCNVQRAQEALSILTIEQINKLKEKYETGGKL